MSPLTCIKTSVRETLQRALTQLNLDWEKAYTPKYIPIFLDIILKISFSRDSRYNTN